ncbi:MAG: FecR protein [Verrucomicrobiales bacterium]|nr:FecR protein [Verrucomicrobiales bacterium]
MNKVLLNILRKAVVSSFWMGLLLSLLLSSAGAAELASNGSVRVLSVSRAGVAEMLPVGAKAWQPLREGRGLKAGERLRTGKNTRAVLLLSDNSQISLGELAEIEIQAPASEQSSISSKLLRGVLYFLHRDRPGTFDFHTPSTSAAIRGT